MTKLPNFPNDQIKKGKGRNDGMNGILEGLGRAAARTMIRRGIEVSLSAAFPNLVIWKIW
jgi:hypothetical protein